MVQEVKKLAAIWQRMFENIDYDYLEIFLVTSRAGGREPAEGRSFGPGKSTFAIWAAYRAHAYSKDLIFVDGDELIDLATEEQRIQIMEDVVRNYLVFTLDDLLNKIVSAQTLIPAIVWDDAQYACPAYQHIPKSLRDKLEILTRVRQRVANIICTAPAISEISKPLRININWEIIIPQRGRYEVQFIGKRRDFYRPVDDRMRLWYDASGTFPPLPEPIDRLYKKLRDEYLIRHAEALLASR